MPSSSFRPASISSAGVRVTTATLMGHVRPEDPPNVDGQHDVGSSYSTVNNDGSGAGAGAISAVRWPWNEVAHATPAVVPSPMAMATSW